MDHNDVRHKLSDYIDGTATNADKTAIENHIQSCQQCSNALRDLQKTIEHVKAVEELEPPAWMTQKIMAKVRAETGKKESFFSRIFTPLRFRMPLQAVAVAFLAVTVFAIYWTQRPTGTNKEFQDTLPFAEKQGTQPEASRSEQAFARKEHVAPSDQAGPPAAVSQKPAYKSLDMKLEYEKPAPPVPASPRAPAAPAASGRTEPMLDRAETMGKSSGAGMNTMPQKKQEQAAGEAVAERVDEKRKAPPAGLSQSGVRAKEAVSSEPVILVTVVNLDTAAKELEKQVTLLKGTITDRKDRDRVRTYVLLLDTGKFPNLIRAIKIIGEIKSQPEAPLREEGKVKCTVELRGAQ